jgi:hypothetical protein
MPAKPLDSPKEGSMATTTDTGAATPNPEESLVAKRRTIAGIDGDGPLYGLALSGGGIRSATFCFGLLRGLARQKVLTRFDYLSTVSGGGYIGAALGRLYQRGQTAQQVQERLDKDDTMLLWWLRSNGRYLTPAGARDLGQAAASMLRNMLFSHFELAALMLLGAAVILLPYVVMGATGIGALLGDGGGWPSEFWRSAGSVWWCGMVFPVFAALLCIFRYWYCRVWPNGAVQFANLGGALLAGVGGALLARSIAASGPTAGMTAFMAGKMVAAFLLLAPLTAALLSIKPAEPSRLAEQRLRYTKQLGAALWCLLGLAAVGLLDISAWWLVDRLFESKNVRQISGGAGTLVVLIALARKWLPSIQRWLTALPTRAVKTEVLLNIGGLLLMTLLALLWMTMLHAMVRPELGWVLWPFGGGHTQLYTSAANWGMVFAVALGYIALTRSDLEVLNLSSLHNFYRARIERAYVSVGNYPTHGIEPAHTRFRNGSPLDAVTRAATANVAKLVEAVDGDDVNLADYKPHVQGGPIHLVSCCINQSVDDRTGNYNADRLGIALTVSALGAETGTTPPVALDQLPAMGKLSRWIAISGAAAASGMGSQTTPGLASLLFLSGLRLGYWSPNLLSPGQPQPRTFWRALEAQCLKPSLLLAECLARFPGLRSTAWYVSDGGHFENTGVYALLKRKLEVIVLADCGADPHYGFEDLENLTRKAQVDYGASIVFIEPGSLVTQSDAETALFVCVGSVKTIHAQPGPQCVLLARIDYDGGTPPGLLIVMKPRQLENMPLEVSGYAARNAAFPQQPTGDQFFDEAQWEAYHQLGLLQGQMLTPNAITAFRSCIHTGTTSQHTP